MRLGWMAALGALSGVRGRQFVATLEPTVPVYSHFVVFGDSLVDNGNGTYPLSKQQWPSDPAYDRGRFTDGPVWPEYLADWLHVSAVDDWSHGGATTNNSVAQGYSGFDLALAVPDVPEQVTRYLASVGDRADADALYIVTGGSNDAFFGLGHVPLAQLSAGVGESLYASASRLVRCGALHLLIPTLPASSATPAVTQFHQSLHALASAFVWLANDAIRAAAAALQAQGAAVTLVYVYRVAQAMHEHAEAYGFTNTRDACLTGTQKPEVDAGIPRRLCDNPSAYLYWDLYHPTTRAHTFFARAALDALMP